MRIPVIANSDPKEAEQLSGRWRTVVRVMTNSRSEATLFLKTSQKFFSKSI